jgi:hypothetical protein
MKRVILPIALFLASCGDEKYMPAEDGQDAGRQFIRASLDGDYKKAEYYLYRDSTNLMLLEDQKSDYANLTRQEKRAYRDASIIPISIKTEDSVTVYYRYYPSSNPKDTTLLRILKKNNEWLVDLKSIIQTQ